MTSNHQAALAAAMRDPDFYPHPVKKVRVRETHISRVFLTGSYVYKIKKPVDFGFLDFTTLEKRHHYCHCELNLNQRLAPKIYLEVLAITKGRGRYHLGGSGRAVEYCLKMRQLNGDCTMRRMLHKGRLEKSHLVALADILADFHNRAEVAADTARYGDWQVIRTNWEENFRQTERFRGDHFDSREFAVIEAAVKAFLKRWRPLFENRSSDGRVRDCHGDLRLGHIYFQDGIQILDCIEFNRRFRYSDVSADLAFLLMELDLAGQSNLARDLLKAYIRRTGDHLIYLLIDFYKCYRAFVRMKINCLELAAKECGTYETQKRLRRIRRYCLLSYAYAMKIARPVLMVVCGLPGSGKSTLADLMGRKLHGNVLASDVVRKKMFAIDVHTRIDLTFEEGIYSPQASALVYGRLLLLAQTQLEKGELVILDATFTRSHHRQEVVRLAQTMGCHYLFIHCRAPRRIIMARLAAREGEAGVISDARSDQFNRHRARFAPLDDIDPHHLVQIETHLPGEDALGAILFQLHRIDDGMPR